MKKDFNYEKNGSTLEAFAHGKANSSSCKTINEPDSNIQLELEQTAGQLLVRLAWVTLSSSTLESYRKPRANIKVK